MNVLLHSRNDRWKVRGKVTYSFNIQLGGTYTVLHIFRQVLFWAGNQGNHQNFEKSLLSYKCWLIFVGMKTKKNSKKKIQNGRLKKTEVFNSPNSQYFFRKISWIGPWVNRINWCEGHWCSSTYMVVRLSDVRAKTA